MNDCFGVAGPKKGNVGSRVRMLRRRTLFAAAIAGLILPMTSALAQPGPPPSPPPGGRPPQSRLLGLGRPQDPLQVYQEVGRSQARPRGVRLANRRARGRSAHRCRRRATRPDRHIQSARTVGTGWPAGGIGTAIAGFGDTATGATSLGVGTSRQVGDAARPVRRSVAGIQPRTVECIGLHDSG
jgi:hypothetical protein